MIRDVVKLLIVYGAGVITTIVCLLLVVTIPTIVSRLTRPKVHEVTSPLGSSVVRDLCMNLDLPVDDPLCQSDAVVYAPDFFPAVRAEFRPGESTHDDVQSKLASYQYSCEPPVTLKDGTASYRCWCNFQGDRVFPIVFVFTESGLLERVFATVGDDWP
jgi:hypothetical protein